MKEGSGIRTQRSPLEVGPKVIALLMQGPITGQQLQRKLGMGNGSSQAWLEALHRDGVIRISGYAEPSANNVRARIYSLQEVPFGKPDVEAPEKGAARPVNRCMRVASVFHLAQVL